MVAVEGGVVAEAVWGSVSGVVDADTVVPVRVRLQVDDGGLERLDIFVEEAQACVALATDLGTRDAGLVMMVSD
jgi:hypothetical protein